MTMDYNQAKKALLEICKRGGSGDEKEVKKILDYHNNTNLINEGLNGLGFTILIFASINHNIKILKLLLSYDNININKQKNYGDTALHCASYIGNKDIIKLLLSHPNIDINIRNNGGQLASDICCESYRADKSNKAIILELFENHSKAKTALTSSTITPSKHSNEGSLSSNNVIPQTTLKESSIVEEVKERELLTVVEEKESLKLQIEGLEEKMREITNNNMKEMERHLQEKENYMKEMDYMKNNRNEIVRILQENNKMMVDNLMKEMGKVVNNTERRLDEKDKDYQRVEIQMQEMVKQMENMMNKLESRDNDIFLIEKRLQEKEKECDQLGDQIMKMEDRFESWVNQMENNVDKAIEKRLQKKERSLVLKPLPLPPNKQTHVFLTHTWREDEKGRNNHDRVGRVNEALRKRGLVTWFDSERMSGTVRQAMTDALDVTCCVLIFITKKYEEKVNSKNEADNCYFEFNVAAHNRNLANMRIPIVMEECMLSQENWQGGGRLMAEVGHQLYFDLSSDDKDVFEERCNEVFIRVVKLLNI